MECTQKLECTQDLYESQLFEKTCPDQIGFLGIRGTKYPVKRGPNKIGRDPQTCNIILNLNSISRQHAVINVLNSKEFMLMDLDSANKTKLVDKTLQPYIPHLLKNGDTVQFGQEFGVFRLFEEDSDLPMTQALDIPETPIFSKHVSRINNGQVTTIPESPDVSDKDDSFIVASQTKPHKDFKTPNNNFIKSSGKRIAIQPVGSKKIDNIYWTSSTKSPSISLRLDDSNNSYNESTVSLKSDTIYQKQVELHEIETQDPLSTKEREDPSYTEATQAPDNDINGSIHDVVTPPFDRFEKDKEHSIYNVETQMPDSVENEKEQNQFMPSPTIYSLETQLPVPVKEQSPTVDENSPIEFNYSQSINNLDTQDPCTFDHQVSNVKYISVSQERKMCLSKCDSIFEADTQVVSIKEKQLDLDKNNGNNVPSENTENIFSALHDLNSQSFQDDFDPKPKDLIYKSESIIDEKKYEKDEDTQKITPQQRRARFNSEELNDCENIHIFPTQKIDSKVPDDDLTDCEDDVFDVETTINDEVTEPIGQLENKTNLQDIPTQVLQEKNDEEDDLQDMLTQVIDGDFGKDPEKVSNFDEVLTQKLDEAPSEKKALDNLPTQIVEENPGRGDESNKKQKVNSINSPFKVPLASPFRVKKYLKTEKQDEKQIPESIIQDIQDDDKMYYAATQDIFNDLCSQKDLFPEIAQKDQVIIEPNPIVDKINDFIFPSSVDDSGTGDIFQSNQLNAKNSSSKQNSEEKGIKNNIFCPDKQIVMLQRQNSDPSDTEVTPKKLKSLKIFETDLPNSQEIKTGVSFSSKSLVTESSSESEVEQIESEESTPVILFKKKIRKSTQPNAKLDLTKKFDLESLPLRVGTRARKPTEKLQNFAKSILTSKYISNPEENIDNEIVMENIARLRTKSKSVKKDNKSIEFADKSREVKPVLDQSEKANQVSEKLEIKQNFNKSKEQKRALDKEKNQVSNMSQELKEISNRHIIQNNDVSIKEKVAKTESKRPRGRPRLMKQSTEDAVVAEIINVINQRNSNKCNDSKNSLLSESNDSGITIHSTSEKCKRSSGRTKTKNNSQNRNIVKEPTRVQVKMSDKKQDNDSKHDENPQNIKRESRTKKQDTKQNDVKQNSTKPDKRKRVTKKPGIIEIRDESSPEKEVDIRRSKRNRKDNSQSVDKLVPKKKGGSGKFDQSTVYNLSSESGHDSPRSLKRSFNIEVDILSAKRSRSNASANFSLRATPARTAKKHYVLFTAFPCEEVKFKLEKLGAVIVTDVTKCTVVLTLQIRRTFKLLCAVGLGVPIVGPNWVQACVDTNMIVDPWLYLMKDETTERRFSFILERTLTGKRSFLSGYNISSTASIEPQPAEMKLIVECSGGAWKNEGPNWICITTPKDKTQWPTLRRKGAILVNTEFILSGVLRQKVEIDKNKFY